MKTNKINAALAFILVPLLPSFITATSFILTKNSIESVLIGFILYTPFSYIFVFCLGIPAYFLMCYMNMLSWLHVTLSGAILGVFLVFIFTILTASSFSNFFERQVRNIDFLLFFALLGAITAYFFWWLAIKDDADKQQD
jgi:hypothetical protein